MGPDEFTVRLKQVRSEVTVLYAKEVMTRLELDWAFKEVLDLVDQSIHEAAQSGPAHATSDEYLKKCASDLECIVHQINTIQGRYSGTVMADDAFGIVLHNKERSVIIVPRADMVGLERIPRVRDSILVQYFHGKCQIAFRK